MPITTITELYAYLAEDTPEEEGLAAVSVANVLMPMVTGERRIAEGPLHQSAQEIANMTGKRLRLVRFSVREELETIEPVKASPPRKGNGPP